MVVFWYLEIVALTSSQVMSSFFPVVKDIIVQFIQESRQPFFWVGYSLDDFKTSNKTYIPSYLDHMKYLFCMCISKQIIIHERNLPLLGCEILGLYKRLLSIIYLSETAIMHLIGSKASNFIIVSKIVIKQKNFLLHSVDFLRKIYFFCINNSLLWSNIPLNEMRLIESQRHRVPVALTQYRFRNLF